MTTKTSTETRIDRLLQMEQDLKEPMAFRWKVQTVSKNKPKAACVAYVDARDVMNRLDAVCGIDGWSDEYEEIGGVLYCHLSLRVNQEPEEWVTKSDCGIESAQEKEKGQASDAFKRAAVKWGVGRFLYSEGIHWVETNEKNTGSNRPYPVDANGKRVWDLTDHINAMLGAPPKKPAPKPEPPKAKEPADEASRKMQVLKLCKDKGDPCTKDSESAKKVASLLGVYNAETLGDLTDVDFRSLMTQLEASIKPQ